MAKAAKRIVPSLDECCRSFILMNLQEFPVSHLSLLPLYERKRLLQHLPIADVCLLEDTSFTQGLDMELEAYWRFPVNLSDSDVKDCDIFTKEWGEAKFAKAVLYGEVISVTIGCMSNGFYSGNEFVRMPDMIQFLYAVRRFPYEFALNKRNIPSRYRDKANSFLKEDLIDAIISCFRGELPRVLAGAIFDNDATIEHINVLCKLQFLSVTAVDCEPSAIPIVQALIKVATDLEVLNLYGDDSDGYHEPEQRLPLDLDGLCADLSDHPTFWSKFRLFQIFASSDGYTISQEVLYHFIKSFLSAPTDHAQTVRFTDTTIVGNDHQTWEFDVPLKTIEFINCQPASKKRKYSEIDSDNDD